MKKKIIYMSIITLSTMLIGMLVIIKEKDKVTLSFEATAKELRGNFCGTICEAIKREEINIDSTESREQQVKEEAKEESQNDVSRKVNTNNKTYTAVTSNKNQNSKTEIIKPEKENVPGEIVKDKDISKNTNKTENSNKPKEEVIETYKVNRNMIAKMKSFIEQNPSEYMQKYGFNIDDKDSNIVNEVNQFTYSESQIEGYILNRFGTIKIYARDYYCNNEYVWTECFIL